MIVQDFSVKLTHFAGTCPIYDPKMMKQFQKLSESEEEVSKKHEIEVVSKWSPTRVHETFWIIRAPSEEVVKKYFEKIGLTLWNEVEIRKVKLLNE